jgi:biopolymer transport protein TolR
MTLGQPGRMNASINITPLVDVVLVLLIIFMVMAPSMMRKGPDVNLPDTKTPKDQGDERGRIIVSIDQTGQLWVNAQATTADSLGDAVKAAVGNEPDPRVVIRGDARLHFREVRQAMLTIEEAGFHGVGLIARKRAEAKGD